MNNKFSQTRTRLEPRKIEYYNILMRKILIVIISVTLVFNPAYVYSKSIKEKIDFYSVINCSKFNNQDEYYFEQFLECIDKESISSMSLIGLKEKRKVEIFDAIAIAGIFSEAIDYGFIDEKIAFDNWNLFMNSNYKKKSDKQKLKNILDNSKCKNLKDYNEFIYCFNSEFRNYEIYQSSSIKTKERMEHIVFNSLVLTEPDGLVMTLKKENLYGATEFERMYEEGDGFEFFFRLMNALGTDYFKKVKNSDVNWKKIVKFIVIAIIVAYLAKGLLKSASKGGSASSSSASSASTTTSGGQYSYSLSYSGSAAKGAFGKGMFRFAPKTSVLQKPWFKYTFARGGFF